MKLQQAHVRTGCLAAPLTGRSLRANPATKPSALRHCTRLELNRAVKDMVQVHVQEVAKETGERPALPRSGHCGCALPADNEFSAIIFGGYTETPEKQRTATNEAWLFSRSKAKWTRLEFESEVPEPRLASQMVLLGDTVWLIAGWNSNKQGPEAFLSDLWALNTKTWAWTQVNPEGASFDSISRFQAVAVGSDIYIHTHRNIEDIYVLHTAGSPPVLQLLPVDGPGPASRGLHSVVAVEEALYLYGGAPKSGPMMGDMWRLDLKERKWLQLHPTTEPHVRCSTACGQADEQHILYFGGAFYGASGGLEMLGDALLFDTKGQEWLSPDVMGQLPSARNAAVCVLLPGKQNNGGRELLVYGGWRAFVETYNDTFILEVASEPS